MIKKFVAILVAIVMVLSTASMMVFASDAPEVFNFVDTLDTNANIKSYSNVTFNANGGRFYKTSNSGAGTVVYDVTGKGIKTVSFETHIYRGIAGKPSETEGIPYDQGNPVVYASEDGVTWGNALECTYKIEGFASNGYVIHNFTSPVLPEGTNYFKIEIPVAGQSYEIQIYTVSYRYKNIMNIKDDDMLLAGNVELVAKTNLVDSVKSLAFYSAGVKLCDAGNAGNGVWRGTWNAAEGIYNVYAVATYTNTSGITGKKSSDAVKVTVVPAYTTSAIEGKDTATLLNGFAVDSGSGNYYTQSAAMEIGSLGLEEGKYEISMRMMMLGYKSVIRNFVIWDKSGNILVRPIAFQIGQPFSYQSASDVASYSAYNQTAINPNVICYGDVWYDVKLVIDTTTTTEDVYVNGFRT